jgi:amino acid adenylation domain-containing protein
VCATWTKVPGLPENSGPPENPPPVGKPVGNHRVYILDPMMRPQPIGVPGELYISGAGLALGYLNRPELTADKFIVFKSPYPPGRAYRTGDLARWRANGEIDVLGRLDHQVKIRGFRIELGEIESCLLSHPGVKEAVVLSKNNDMLNACFVPAGTVAKEQLREHLAQSLPGYMVPSNFIELEKMPLNANGKIDRRALAALPISSGKEPMTGAIPANGREKAIADTWKEVLELPDVGIHDNFFEIGGNSIRIVNVHRKLKKNLDINVPLVKLFEYPTVHSFSRYLESGTQNTEPAVRREKPAAREESPAAVTGMSGVFPGAANIHELWDNLVRGIESITFFRPEEVEGPRPAGSIDARGVVMNADYFDAAFFDYTPREAQIMDPQVRLFHQCAWHALEDAGYDPFSYGGRIGLYAGAGSNVYWEALTLLSAGGNSGGEFQAGLLGDKDFMCSRISYKLDLKGPCYNVQTACSTSLAAIHMAVRGLAGGECDMALAGGVGVSFPQHRGYVYQEGMIYSADGHCRPFDAAAGGTVGGGGAAVVLLKKYPDAVTDRDHIYALIKGSAVNNDGIRKVGYSAPGVEGQTAVIQSALADADVEPGSITYIETHGAGTELGDSIEIEALKKAFNGSKKQFCAIGSVKSNLGHLDAASGATGFIKTVLALKHRFIPPTLHFTRPNPVLGLDDSPFYVVSEPTPWEPNGGPLRAGVSSMGMGGTNAHVILEEAPPPAQVETPADKPGQRRLLLLSARSAPALEDMTRNLASHFRQSGAISLADAAYTLQAGRKHFRRRKMAMCSSVEEAITLLDESSSKAPAVFSGPGKPRVIFVFPGQGSQYWNMGLDLYRTEPLFRRTLDRCFNIINPILGCDAGEVLYAPEFSSLLHRRDITPPVLFAFEYALARLLMEWGIQPDAMIGYSLGEFVAACLAGVFKLEDALALVARRSLLVHEKTPIGAMSSVPLSEDQLMPLLESNKKISLATVNGPSCIVSGTLDGVAAFEQEMKSKRLICTRLNSTMASHSAVMESIREEFGQMVESVEMAAPSIPYISNLTGGWISADQAMSARYWAEHICAPVRFADGAEISMEDENTLFIEMGPGRLLSNILRGLPAKKPGQLILNIVRHEHEKTADDGYLLKQLGRMWLYGLSVDWASYHSGREARRIPLPGYPFESLPYRLDPSILERAAELFPAATMKLTEPTAPAPAPGNGGESIAAAAPEFYEEKPYAAPRGEVEKQTARVWQEVLGFERVGIFDNFFHINGDSLTATQMTARLREIYGVEIPVKELFEDPTIAHTAQLIINKMAGRLRAENEDETRIVPRETHSPAVCSFGQRRLWIIDRLMPGKAFYNTPAVQRISGHLDIPVFERAVNEMIKRHQALRTVFKEENDEPLQVILEELKLSVAVEDLRHLRGAGQDAEVRRLALAEVAGPFDLETGPLLRMTLLRLDRENYVLLFISHHIISDIWSMTIFIRELTAIYSAFLSGKSSPLPEPVIQYADYALWQRRRMQGETAEKQMTYWREQLGADIPVLELPADRPRPPVQTFSGDIMDYRLSPEPARQIITLAQEQQCSLFMVILAVLNLLLYRYSGQDDILVGAPVAGRNRVELESLIGYCSNTLVFRTSLTGNPPFRELLAGVRRVTSSAYDNQDIPFERLVEEFQPARYMSHTPLFQVMLVTHAPIPGTGESAGLTLANLPVHNKTCKFDLWFSAFDADGELSGQVEYNTDIFDEPTIRRLTGHFKTLLEGISADPDRRIDAFPLMPEVEKEQLLFHWNDTAAGYPVRCLHHAFEDRAARTPEAPAAAFEGQEITYRRLNHLAGLLARRLRRLGAVTGMPAGICLERSIELVIGLLGILKAGGAYMPLDPDYPRERLAFMVKDAALSLLVTSKPLMELLPFYKGKTIILDGHQQEEDAGTTAHKIMPHHPAYIIYTSGSTGKPKGVVVPHEGISNRLEWMQSEYHLSAEDRVLQKTPFSFDVSVWEFFWPLLEGALLVLARPGGHKDGAYLVAMIREYKITTMHFVPTMLGAFLETPGLTGIPSLKRVICSGEALPAEYRDRFYDIFGGGVALHNLYGPTEASVDVTYWQCKPGGGRTIPIGRPVANTRMYVLDRGLEPTPIGIPGEIHIGGVQLAHGYLNRPELTAQRFAGLNRPYLKENKLYKTGDLGRWRPDGTIEFLGRLDHQVKIRGFRIELGEIETQLRNYPLLEDAAVLVREDRAGDKKLVGYGVLRGDYSDAQDLPAGAGEDTADGHVSDWRGVFEDTYRRPQEDEVSGGVNPDPFFNVSGWNSSYTGGPIPPEEMRRWLDSTAARILALKPGRIMEIGCGAGLFLFRLMPRCKRYLGADIAAEGLDYIRRHLEKNQTARADVELQLRAADDFKGLEKEAPDLVLLNSVVQYFPSPGYLVKVLSGAAKIVKPGGTVFIGDVRSLPLLGIFHASVEFDNADSPRFFYALVNDIPQISGVELLLKYGGYNNELSKFRYDVILHIGGGEELESAARTLDWQPGSISAEDVRRELTDAENSPGIFILKGVPDARIVEDLRVLRWLTGRADRVPETADEYRRTPALPGPEEKLPAPEVFPGLIEDLPYDISLTLDPFTPGRYDVVFRHRRLGPGPVGIIRPSAAALNHDESYTNNPLLFKITRRLAPELRDFLKERVPEYMVPPVFVLLDRLPFGANGKLDRGALPFPESAGLVMSLNQTLTEPRNDVEKLFRDAWTQVLGTGPMGIDTNFFQLGGDSIQAIRVISVLNREGYRLSIQDLYKHQTIEELARVAEPEPAGPDAEPDETVTKQIDREALLKQLPEDIEIEDAYPTTPMQRHMIRHLRHHSASGGPVFIFQRIHAPVPMPADFGAIRKTMEILTDTYPILRTVILWENPDEPVQVVCKNLAADVSCWDLSELEPEAQRVKVKELMKEEWRRGIERPLSHPMRLGVVKLGTELFQHFITCDYPRMDGWGVRFIYRDMAPCYLAVLEGREFHRESNNDYKTYLYRLHGQDLDKARHYWRELLAGYPEFRPHLERIPGNHPGEAKGFARQYLKMPIETAARLDDVLRRNRLTFSVVVQGVWALILARLTGDNDIVCGFLTTGRSIASAEVERMTGHAINILPVRLTVLPTASLFDWLRQLTDKHMEWLRYDYTQIDHIYGWLEPTPSPALFDTVVVVQNLQFEQETTAPSTGEDWDELNTFHARVDYPVRLDVSTGREIEILFNYDRRFVTDTVIRGLLENIRTLIQRVAENPGLSLEGLINRVRTHFPPLPEEKLKELVNRIQ